MFRLVIALILMTCTVADAANVFNMPAGQTSLEFVTIGDPGNAPDNRYLNTYTSRPNLLLGSVPYEYQIGKYDVTAAQFIVFLNAVAKSDSFGIANGTSVTRSGTSGNFSYSIPPIYDNYPIGGVTWISAARFVNWLHNGQPTGPQGPNTTESGVYDLATVGPFTINGNEVTRNPNSSYFLPSEDEWYKAAYYKGGGVNAGYWTYATQNDTAPSNMISPLGTNNAYYNTFGDGIPVGTFVGSPSYYGTYDQSGNGKNWTETYFPTGFGRIIRDGNPNASADRISAEAFEAQSASFSGGAFRVAAIAAIPEPSSTLVVLGLLAAGLGVMRLRKR